MTKESYLSIRNSVDADVTPVLHYYYNKSTAWTVKALSLEEFRYAWSGWIQNPLMLIKYGAMLTSVFNELDKEFGI